MTTDQQFSTRAVTAADFDAVMELLNGVFRHAHGVTDQSIGDDYPLYYRTGTFQQRSRVIEQNGKIVSHAALWPREWQIGGETYRVGLFLSVATYPEHRGKGFAAELVREQLAVLQAEQFDFGLLWTAVPEFYVPFGWEQVVPQGMMATLPNPALPENIPDVWNVRRLDLGHDLQRVCDIHDSEQRRFTRTVDEAKALFSLPRINSWVLEEAGEVLAYVVHGQAFNKRGVIEYGGETEPLTALLNEVIHRDGKSLCGPIPSGMTDRHWTIYSPRQDLLQWAEKRQLPLQPLRCSKGFGNEMIFRVNKDRVTDAVVDQLFVWGLDWA